jgi:hypothetical protein
MAASPGSLRRLVFPASGLIALCAFVHACGGGGSSGGGGTPPPIPSPGPGPTTFVSTFQYPANSSVDVPRAPIILIGFSDTVNPATVNSTNVSLTQAATPVATTLSYNACNNRIQMLPNVALDPGLVYTVNLGTGLQDDDGESLTASTFSFTTNSDGDSVRPTFTQAGFMAIPNPGTETTAMQLDWADATDNLSTSGAISYRVYVSTNGCFNYAAPAIVVGPGTLQAIVPVLTSRTTYQFVVRAVDAAGNESVNTASISQTTFTSLGNDVFPLVSSRCVGCHVAGGQAVLQGINMNYASAGDVYDSWVSQTSQCVTAATNGFGTRVVPGDAASSFLWNKVSGLPAGVVCGSQMPLGQTPLDAGELSIIEDWINQGAIEN